MDPNLQTPVSNEPSVNPLLQQVPVQPQTPPPPQAQPAVQPQPQQEQGGGKKMLKLLVLIFVLAILALGGFFAYSYFNPQKTYNAGVYNYPTSVPVTPAPINTLNPNDTSDSSIDSNNQIVNQNLNALDSDLNSASDSLNDKQTNLQ